MVKWNTSTLYQTRQKLHKLLKAFPPFGEGRLNFVYPTKHNKQLALRLRSPIPSLFTNVIVSARLVYQVTYLKLKNSISAQYISCRMHGTSNEMWTVDFDRHI